MDVSVKQLPSKVSKTPVYGIIYKHLIKKLFETKNAAICTYLRFKPQSCGQINSCAVSFKIKEANEMRKIKIYYFVFGRETAIPPSTINFPSAPVRTVIFPPDPIKILIFPRSFCTVTSALAASSLILMTGLTD